MPLYEFDGRRPSIGADTFVHPTAVIIGDAAIGSECYIGAGAVIRADFARIVVGDMTSIQDNAVLHVTPGDRTDIGSKVIVAHGAILHDATVRDRCVIGIGAVLLPKAVCEEDAFVAAGAVVTPGMVVPSGKVAAGNPAKIVRDVSPELEAWVRTGVEEYRMLTKTTLATLKEIS